jgi:hypothetical protein
MQLAATEAVFFLRGWWCFALVFERNLQGKDGTLGNTTAHPQGRSPENHASLPVEGSRRFLVGQLRGFAKLLSEQ